MCGRYTTVKDFSGLIKLVGIVMRVPFFAPRYNIAPTQMAPVIFKKRHQPAVKLMRWGLIPSWAKDESVGNALINARSETLQMHMLALEHPLDGPLKIYPVSDLVNSPKMDDARCIQPVRIERDMFERQWWVDS